MTSRKTKSKDPMIATFNNSILADTNAGISDHDRAKGA